MPNIIELNLLENKSIVATMQGYPLANENSYKIIAGEENATKFIIKSIPNQYANARLTVEMVNSQGLGIAERELSEIEVDLVSYKGFILPVGMAVAGYGYVSIKAYIGDEVAVFQPLKLKVWNTIPQWKDYVDKTTNVKVVDGYLILTENGNEYNLGYVQGDKGDKGDKGDTGEKGEKGDKYGAVSEGNFFDNMFDESGYINPSDGINAYSDGLQRTSKYYPFGKGTLYFYASAATPSLVFLFYDKDKQYKGYHSFNNETSGQVGVGYDGFFRVYCTRDYSGNVYFSTGVPSLPIDYTYSPTIAKRDFTVVCFGDSIIGNTQNHTSVPAQLSKKSGGRVFNAGFGGCRMSTHAIGWDRCSMYRIAEYIANGDFSSLVAATDSGWSGMPSYFDDTAKTLEGIDFADVDLITISYGTNDYREGYTIDREDKTPFVDLFDGVFDESGFVNPTTGVNVEAADYKRTSKFYPVPTGTSTVYVKLTETVRTFTLVCYNANKECVEYASLPDDSQGGTLTLPSGTAYFRPYTNKEFMGGCYISTENVGIPPQYDYTTVCGALRYAIKRISSKYPHIKILVTTPVFRTFFDNENNYSVAEYSDTKDWGGGTLLQYAEAIKKACADMKVSCLDLYNESGLNEVTRLHYYPHNDGTHPNEKGRKLIGTLISGKISGLI